MKKQNPLKRKLLKNNEMLPCTLDNDREEVLQEIMRVYGRMIQLTALKYTNNYAEAEEVAQEVFLTIYNKLDTLQHRQALGSWIFKITRNLSFQRNKTKKRNKDLIKNLNLSDRKSSLLADLLDSEAKNIINQAVESLPHKYKTVFILNEYRGMPLKDISEKLNLTLPAVKSRLHRARLQLKTSLESYFKEIAQ